jgi:ADP-ribose pyrophosphatase YjhB (NUDIX family)
MEVGETVEQAVVRETREETTVEVRPVEVITVADFIEKAGARIHWHYVLVDVLCAPVRGEPFPQSDAENARFVEMRELGELDVAPTALGVIEHALIRRREGPDG